MESGTNKLQMEEIIATQKKGSVKRWHIPVACSMTGISRRGKRQEKNSCLRGEMRMCMLCVRSSKECYPVPWGKSKSRKTGQEKWAGSNFARS